MNRFRTALRRSREERSSLRQERNQQRALAAAPTVESAHEIESRLADLAEDRRTHALPSEVAQ